MLTILLVEDNEVDVMNARRAFARSHIMNPLFVSGNGLEALEMLRHGEVPKNRRLVLLDLDMPRMNGIEFLRAVRQDPELRATPVVVLTPSNHEGDKVEAYTLTVTGYLVKPVMFGNFCKVMVALNKVAGYSREDVAAGPMRWDALTPPE
ncbi:MAG TPA: response regulator [Alphaproteobacteria bacterium]|nr:response regulator [Alphaproteobacteria bacterium]